MDIERKKKRRPRKIYKTVIKLSPPKPDAKGTMEPGIEIDVKTLRPKLIGPIKKFKKRDSSQLGSEFQGKDKSLKIAERYDEALIQRMEWVPVTKNTRWKCIRCGWCCSHEWRVNLTWNEYDRLKDKLPISEMVVDQGSGMSHPFYMIKKSCVQYDIKTRKCKIYSERAYTCATYPFALTPEGKLVRSKFCRGFGHGSNVDRPKMIKYIKKMRKRAGMKV